ncbi:MAG: hypothetical protein M0Q26_10040 [Chitinophagaceae bacterium]|nr:hypothetical protein [Chitinophagaceae bacterium]
MKISRHSLIVLNFLFLLISGLKAQTNTFPSSGNVGIGVTNPGTTLDVRATFASFNLIGTNTTSPNIGSAFSISSNQDALGRTIIGTAGQSRAMYFENNGNVVIPNTTLTVSGTGNSSFTGNVGIGIANPGSKLWLQNAVSAGSNNYMLTLENPTTAADARSGMRFWVNAGNTAGATISISNDNYSGGSMLFNTIASGTESVRMTILALNGNVGIGTTAPFEKLSVNGNISTKKLIVTQTGWSDYVFDKDYKLRSLQSLEAYINQYKHLPEVPTAKEVEAKGISVGDNQALLLKKIEELTLYVIAQQKQIDNQAKEIEELKNKK